MAYAYQEILDIGEQKGLQKGLHEGELKTRLSDVREVLAIRFPQHAQALDDLLPKCNAEDLKWLHREALQAKTTAALRPGLEARLQGK